MPYKSKGMIADWLDPKSASVFDPLYKRAIRGIATATGLNDPETSLETASPTPLGAMVGMAKKIAPKRAARELVDVLLGRSTRLPEGAGLKPLTDADAQRMALFSRTTGSAPPAPTYLLTSEHSGFAPLSRALPRSPGLTEEFRKWQTAKGLNPSRRREILINPNRRAALDALEDYKKSDSYIGATNRQPAAHEEFKELAQRSGGIQQGTGFKLKTERELRSLFDGPQKAFKAGKLKKQDYRDLMKRNRQQVSDYFDRLRQLDKNKYDEATEMRLMQLFDTIGG